MVYDNNKEDYKSMSIVRKILNFAKTKKMTSTVSLFPPDARLFGSLMPRLEKQGSLQLPKIIRNMSNKGFII